MPAQQADQLTYQFADMNGEQRLRELILYIADKCVDTPRFGVTKLIKILYFSDFVAYAQRGRPITGIEYIKQQRGPMPAIWYEVQKSLEHSGEIEMQHRQLLDYEQHRVIAKRRPDLSLFTGEDIALVDAIIDQLRDHTAEAVSQLSHGLAWQIVDDLDHIPYEAALLGDPELTPDDIAWAQERIEAYERNRGAGDLGSAVLSHPT